MAEKTKERKELEKPRTSTGPMDEMERWLDEFVPARWMRRWGWPSWGELARPGGGFMPRIDVIEHDDEILVEAQLPGVKKEDLDVSVTEDSVTLKGSTKKEKEEEEGDYYRREIASGAFSRTVALPGTVDSDKAKAKFDDGLLKLRLPRVEKAKRRSITVE